MSYKSWYWWATDILNIHLTMYLQLQYLKYLHLLGSANKECGAMLPQVVQEQALVVGEYT